MSDIMTVQGLDLWYGDHQALHDILSLIHI